jgi:hypothetical protein
MIGVRRLSIVVALALSTAQHGLAAQVDTVVVVRPGRIPSRIYQVEQWAVDLFNHPRTTRVVGQLVIDRAARYTNDVAVLGGPLVVGGVIEGDLVAINSDLEVLSTAVIHGNVVVLGGRLTDARGAVVRGSFRRYGSHANVRLVGDRLELIEVRAEPRRARRTYRSNRGSLNLLIGTGGTYNRVEGLPIKLGAMIDWRSSDVRARLLGYGTFRTAGDYEGGAEETTREDVGYGVEGSIRWGRGPQAVTIGGRFFDEVIPTQGWPLALNEVGWASFLWHRDYRDYYLQRGVQGFIEVEPTHHVTLAGEIARVEEHSIEARDPWTPWRRDEVWRPNVVIDEGDFTLFSASFEYDSRPGRRSRSPGILLRFRWDRGIGEDVVESPLPLSVRDPLPMESYTWDRAQADVRLYQRVGWGGQLRLRGFWAGTIGDDPLPVQRRFSLGGPDPMNGFEFRRYACNAGVIDAAIPGLCDHVLLFQAEYRGHIGFDWFGDEFWSRRDPGLELEDFWDWDWDDWFWFDGPTIVLFSNAGTGWLDSEDIPSLGFDVGAGIEFGSVGFYGAKALGDDGDDPVRWTLRIERRF